MKEMDRNDASRAKCINESRDLQGARSAVPGGKSPHPECTWTNIIEYLHIVHACSSACMHWIILSDDVTLQLQSSAINGIWCNSMQLQEESCFI